MNYNEFVWLQLITITYNGIKLNDSESQVTIIMNYVELQHIHMTYYELMRSTTNPYELQIISMNYLGFL